MHPVRESIIKLALKEEGVTDVLDVVFHYAVEQEVLCDDTDDDENCDYWFEVGNVISYAISRIKDRLW